MEVFKRWGKRTLDEEEERKVEERLWVGCY